MTLALADDHPIILDGLEQLFRNDPKFTVVVRCADGEEAVEAVRSLEPDILILDIRMPRKDGIQVLREMKRMQTKTSVVLLTAALDDTRLLEAFRLGAAGLVLKEMAPRLLVQAVLRVYGGDLCWDNVSVAGALRKMVEREEDREQIASRLTPREIEIARMVAEGMRNREIAGRLNITEGTVKIHLHSIYEKLQIDGRVALSNFARDHSL